MKQLDLNLSGKELKEVGIQRAIDKAERVNPGWKERAYGFLCEYVKKNEGEFLAEDVREASNGIIPTAPHGRAWGGIISRAAFYNVIRRVGYRKVKNPNCHNALASLWKRV